jgi:hypothetical protein
VACARHQANCVIGVHQRQWGVRKKPLKSIPFKKKAVASPEKTDAPPAIFLEALKIGNLAELIVEQTKFQRQASGLVEESTDKISDRVWLELVELADRVLYPRLVPHGGLENAAEHLSATATAAANFLEQLAHTGAKDMIIAAAERKNSWPVNMRLGNRKKKGSNKFVATLQDFDKVKDFLIDIRLGQSSLGPLKSLNDLNATIFTKTAELLFSEMIHFREFGAAGFRTAWAKKLMLLRYPMTTDNNGEWWSVAKLWMDEQWKSNPELFEPLVAACKSKGKSLAGNRHDLYRSEVKRNVIDVSLRSVFLALAKPANL